MSRPAQSAPADALDLAILAFSARWDRGEPVRAEDYVGLFPVAAAAELIYHEYCLAEAAHLGPDPADFLRRFPDHSAILDRLFSLHGALSMATIDGLAGPARFPQAGDSIGPYRLLRELGRGAFARVFLAEQADLGDRLVVVKVSTRPSAEPALLGRARHAHIVEVLRHTDADDGALHLVCMPFLGGATLAAVLQARREAPTRRLRRPRAGRDLLTLLDRASAPEYPATDLPRPAREIMARISFPRAVAWMVARLADALDHAARRGVTHGDIKPSNILIPADGMPMLFDFNLAVDWHVAGELGAGADLGGTLAYMAPERLRAIADPDRPGEPAASARRRQPDRHRADLYALGLVLAEALTGEPPETPARESTNPRSFASDLADLRGGPTWSTPALRARSIPPALRAILARCLAPDPGDRYARGGELAADLDRWRSDRPLIHAPEPARTAWGRKFRSRRFPLAAAILTAIVAGGVALAANRILEGTQRDQALAKWDDVLDHTDGVFRLKRPGRWESSEPGEPADVANRHLARYNVEDYSRPWRERDDVRALPDRERGELEAWALEQVLRKAVALADRPSSPSDWDRARLLLTRTVAQCPASAFRNLRATLGGRPGLPPAEPRLAPVEPPAPAPPAWLEAYLAGVAAEPLQAREALGRYLDALRDRPDHFWAHYRAAVVACRIDEYQVACDHLRACVARRPRNEILWTQLSNVELRLVQDRIPGSSLADAGAAQAECDRALAINPDYAEALFARTLIRRAAGQEEGVRADLDRFTTLTQATNLARALELRFTAKIGPELNFFTYTAENEALLREAVRHEPADEANRIKLAINLDQAGRKAEAGELYDQIIAADPDHLWARYLRADHDRQSKDPRAIIELTRLIEHPRFDETFRDQPNMIRAYHYVADDLMMRGKLAEAEAVARRSLAAIRRSHSLQQVVISARIKGQEKLDPIAETDYLLARINAVAARTDPKRMLASIEFLRAAFDRQPSFRRDWFANDLIFRSHRAEILDAIDRTVDR